MLNNVICTAIAGVILLAISFDTTIFLTDTFINSIMFTMFPVLFNFTNAIQ